MTPEERPRPDSDHVREQLRGSDPAAPERSRSDAARESGGSAEPVGNGSAAPGDPVAEAEAAEGEASDDAAATTDGAVGDAEPEADEGAALRRERDEYLELARRTQADFENYRKRAAKDIASAGGRARVGVIRELLPVVDNLERALAAAPADDGLAEGVRMTLAELHGVLTRTGVEAIEPSGDRFDPTFHEALSTREQEGADSGVVLDVVEKGYRTEEVVIRPARVVVAA